MDGAAENQAEPTPENKREPLRGGGALLIDANLAEGSKHPLYIRVPTADRTSHVQLEANAQVCNIMLTPAVG